MAEFIMKDLAAKCGLADMLEIKSAATSSEEIGNGVYPPARKVLAKHNILCGGKTAVRMTEADYEYYDLIVVMDKNNLRNIRRTAGDEPKGKISMLRH